MNDPISLLISGHPPFAAAVTWASSSQRHWSEFLPLQVLDQYEVSFQVREQQFRASRYRQRSSKGVQGVCALMVIHREKEKKGAFKQKMTHMNQSSDLSGVEIAVGSSEGMACPRSVGLSKADSDAASTCLSGAGKVQKGLGCQSWRDEMHLVSFSSNPCVKSASNCLEKLSPGLGWEQNYKAHTMHTNFTRSRKQFDRP